MTSIGQLYSYMPNARVLKIQAAARLNGLRVEIPEFQFGVTNKTTEFRAKFPAGKVPAFEASGSSELKLAESDAIAQYVAGSGPQAATLLGHTVAEQAQIRQWICFAENEVYAPMLSVVLWRVGFQPFDPQTEASGAEALGNALQVVETQLGRDSGKSIVCGRMTLADLSLASALYWAFMHYLDGQLREQFPLTVDWYQSTTLADGVREVFGEPNFVQVRRTWEG